MIVGLCAWGNIFVTSRSVLEDSGRTYMVFWSCWFLRESSGERYQFDNGQRRRVDWGKRTNFFGFLINFHLIYINLLFLHIQGSAKNSKKLKQHLYGVTFSKLMSEFSRGPFLKLHFFHKVRTDLLSSSRYGSTEMSKHYFAFLFGYLIKIT